MGATLAAVCAVPKQSPTTWCTRVRLPSGTVIGDTTGATKMTLVTSKRRPLLRLRMVLLLVADSLKHNQACPRSQRDSFYKQHL